MITVRIKVDDNDLAGKFALAEKIVKKDAQLGTKQVGERGKELAKGYAPKATGQLEAFIDDRWWGGLKARVYIRKGGFLTHDNRPSGPTGRGHHYGHGYGYWQEVGAYGYRNPFMEPAADDLNGGIAGDIMDSFMFAALSQAGLLVSF